MTGIFTEFDSFSADETMLAGKSFIEKVKVGEKVALIGSLGAGKTTFVRGAVQALGYTGTVRSPSFMLVNHYPAELEIIHADLYRIQNPAELLALNLEVEAENRILFVEWGNRFEAYWGPTDWRVEFHIDPQHEKHRLIRVKKVNPS